MARHNILGKEGENLAATFLQENGYDIVARNFSFRGAEIDIIAEKDNILTVVEVKTRSTPDFGAPESFLRQRQISSLVGTINHFVTDHHLDLEIRFDVVAIIKNEDGIEIKHLKDAFLHF